MIYIIKGPFEDKDGRRFVIVRDNGRRRKINYAKYLLLKEGVKIKKNEDVHHIDEDKTNDALENLEVKKEYLHKQFHRKEKNE